MSRRRLVTAAISAAVAGVAGCAGSDGSPASDDGGDADRTTTASSTSTLAGGPADGVIDSTADYDSVTSNQDEWRGQEVSASSVKYYQPYREEYQGFRAFLDTEGAVRPFFLKTDEEFSEQSRPTVSFTGTIEKFGEIEGVAVIFVENVTIER